jgi:GT2 family glycosyltransferase
VAQDYPSDRFEIIVIEDGGPGVGKEVVDWRSRTSRVSMRYFSVARAGPAAARNRGWRAARCEIAAFTDDDCYPAPDFVERLGSLFDGDETLGFVGGAVLLHDPLDASLATVRRSEPLRFESGMFIAAGTLLTANLAFRREVLEEIGGFDERFGLSNGLGGSDVDAVVRAVASGWRGLYDPHLVVRHHHGRRTREEIDRVRRSYDVGRGAFYAKCLLDRRLRRTDLVGWIRLIAERAGRGRGGREILRELRGSGRYLLLRLRGS